MKTFTLLAICFALIFSSCTQDEIIDILDSHKKDIEQYAPEKDKNEREDEKDNDKDQKLYKKIVKRVVFSDDCKYPVSGIVEFYNEKRELVFTIDYGNGVCDMIAIKIVGDKRFKIILNKTNNCKGKDGLSKDYSEVRHDDETKIEGMTVAAAVKISYC